MFGKTGYRTGGTRGGRDQFKWDDVKNDNYRENYLGHSLHAAVGRWQKGKDLTWWNKKKQMSKEDRKEEMRRVREAEEDMMRAAMGLPPKHDRPTPKLSKEDMQMALKRGGTERDDYDAGERVEGIGLAPIKSVGPKSDGISHRVLTQALEGSKEEEGNRLRGDKHALAGEDARDFDDGAGSRASDSPSKAHKKDKHKKKKKKKKKKHKHKHKHKKKEHKKHASATDSRSDSEIVVPGQRSFERAPSSYHHRSEAPRATRSRASLSPSPSPSRPASPPPSPSPTARRRRHDSPSPNRGPRRSRSPRRRRHDSRSRSRSRGRGRGRGRSRGGGRDRDSPGGRERQHGDRRRYSRSRSPHRHRR